MNMLKRLLPAFLITLIVVAGCKSEKYNFDDLPPTVKSFFTISNAELNIDEEILFNNESENAESYTWDFGDGTKSSEKNPTKIYTAPGAYVVSLKAVGPGGTGNYTQQFAVIDPNAVINADKELYFIEYGTKNIKKISLDLGATLETVVNMTGKEGHGMAYDVVNDKIYYCDFQSSNSGKILRMNTDGTGIEELITGLASPYGIAINQAAGKIYIADGPNVSRANLDGSGFEKEFIKVTGGAIRAIGYNSKTDVIYFYEVNNEDLYSVKSDGTGLGKIISDSYGYGLFIDETNEKIYYDERNSKAIMQANLDGSSKVKIVDLTGNRGGSGMAIDYKENKFYWSETNNGIVKRCNLDGTGAETFLSGVSNPRGMFIKNK